MPPILDWLVMALGWLLGWGLCCRVPRLPPGDAAQDRHVTVIIPVRNEAATLPTLLEALSSQTRVPGRVIVVDDGSTDGTAERARAFPGVHVARAPPLPAGWTGKAWACHVGATLASGDLLLFLDADVDLAPDAVARVLAAHAGAGGLVSVQPHHRVGSWLEQGSAFFNLVAFMGTGFGGAVRGRPSAAFGPCLAVSRVDYERVGGHARVRCDVVEDLGLGRAFADSGLPVTGFVGKETVTYRMYPGGGWPLVEGWSKNMALGALGTAPLRALAIALWITALLLVPLEMLRAPMPLGLAVAYAACAVQVAVLLRPLGTFRAAVALAYPAFLVVFVVVFARSMYLTLVRRTVTWRGRTLSVPSRTEMGDAA